MVAGEDAEIKQLLWVIENLQEELHISNRAFGIAESQQRESQSVVDQLQVFLLALPLPYPSDFLLASRFSVSDFADIDELASCSLTLV